MTSAIVNMEAVAKSFGSQQVLQGLDWQIEPGKVIGLLGRNGAGKSTLIECLLGLREPDAGAITLFGEPAGALGEAVRARIGYVPQQSELYEWLTPLQMLAYFKVLYPRWNNAKVDGLLKRWGFGKDLCHKQIGRLSGGEKQRLSIIRALAHEPDLLVLDEPVASLDPVGRRDFLRELVDGVIERDTTVIFSTHILSDLERVALDVAFLKDGKIALQAPLDELLESAHRVTGSAAAMQGLQLPGEIRRQRGSDGSVSVLARLSTEEANALGAAHAVHIDALGLEDLFVEVSQ
jgi:ABC-2 type transport system ATP-binding protein